MLLNDMSNISFFNVVFKGKHFKLTKKCAAGLFAVVVLAAAIGTLMDTTTAPPLAFKARRHTLNSASILGINLTNESTLPLPLPTHFLAPGALSKKGEGRFLTNGEGRFLTNGDVVGWGTAYGKQTIRLFMCQGYDTSSRNSISTACSSTTSAMFQDTLATENSEFKVVADKFQMIGDFRTIEMSKYSTEQYVAECIGRATQQYITPTGCSPTAGFLAYLPQFPDLDGDWNYLSRAMEKARAWFSVVGFDVVTGSAKGCYKDTSFSTQTKETEMYTASVSNLEGEIKKVVLDKLEGKAARESSSAVKAVLKSGSFDTR